MMHRRSRNSIPASFLDRYGPWALVAGASEGLGAEFAEQLAACGFGLVLVARRRAPLEALAARLARARQISTRALTLDLGSRAALGQLIAATHDLDVGLLVCNAALAPVGSFLERPFDEHVRLLDVNCRAALVLSHHFGQRMTARRRGGIVLVSSMAAMQGTALVAHYAASKAYLLRLAEGLWAELQPRGVDVVGCCPGYLRTPTFLATRPLNPGFPAPPTGDCQPCVEETLLALGQVPAIIPGRANRLTTGIAQRLLPRSLVVRLAGRVTRKMYPSEE